MSISTRCNEALLRSPDPQMEDSGANIAVIRGRYVRIRGTSQSIWPVAHKNVLAVQEGDIQSGLNQVWIRALSVFYVRKSAMINFKEEIGINSSLISKPETSGLSPPPGIIRYYIKDIYMNITMEIYCLNYHFYLA